MCRCDIPVVIMGETGCGKTRLIRYMCELQNCNKTIKNLVMLKVIDEKLLHFAAYPLTRYMVELLNKILLIMLKRQKS